MAEIENLEGVSPEEVEVKDLTVADLAGEEGRFGTEEAINDPVLKTIASQATTADQAYAVLGGARVTPTPGSDKPQAAHGILFKGRHKDVTAVIKNTHGSTAAKARLMGSIDGVDWVQLAENTSFAAGVIVSLSATTFFPFVRLEIGAAAAAIGSARGQLIASNSLG